MKCCLRIFVPPFWWQRKHLNGNFSKYLLFYPLIQIIQFFKSQNWSCYNHNLSFLLSLSFKIRFCWNKIDFVGEFEHQSGAPNSRGKLPHGSKGFRFLYVQRQCEKERCFQCNFLKNGVHEAKSCPGPHFHKVISNFNCFF